MLPTPYIKCDYDKVYEPSEDSFLVLDSLEKDVAFLNKRFQNQLAMVCEIGPGSDISPWALEATKETAKLNKCTEKNSYLEVIQSDLTSSVRKNQVDILVFNPPYVPAEAVPEVPSTREDTNQWLDLALLGGKDGMAITQKVLDQLDQILSPNGVAYILFCARNKPEELVSQIMQTKLWNIELVENRKAGWEVLSVYRFTRK